MREFQYKMTIIMPSYNNGQYIKQALDSILMQKVNFNYQIIITDDCSQDDSPIIIKEYESLYPDRVLALYSNKNCRLFQNVLKALKQMDSEYFCVLDPDDYWSDKKHLQKAVDFLDKNTEYTIYGTNAYKLYTDGTTELYYDHLGIHEYTSTYEDYLKGTSILSNTFGSTYRNVYFDNGVPDEYLKLKGTQFEETFRADSARNLIHLKRGKSYFLNESIGYSRRHGKGLASGLKEYERHITVAFANVGFFEFFGEENEVDFERIIRNKYIMAIKAYFQTLVFGNVPIMTDQYKRYFSIVMEWLQLHQITSPSYIRVPFSLERFSEMADRKMIIWGTGRAASRFIAQYHIPIREDTFFIDNNEKKQGKEYMGRLIKNPIVLKDEPDALIIIASSYYKEIIMQIRKQELCSINRIINIYDYERDGI